MFRVLRDVHPQALGVTYWFDAAPNGEPYPVSVHVAGRLRGKAPTEHKDSFEVVGTVDRVLPGSGRVALTVRAEHLPAGAWDVTATPVRPARPGAPAWAPVRDPRLPTASASGATTFAPLARAWAPGVRPGAWPALVATGAVLGILAQSLLAGRLGLPLQRLLPLSVLACVLGAVGGKAYYLATHRSERAGLLTGASVQGFVLVAVTTLVGGSILFDLPAGTVLDVTAPALLIGMAVGRVGCLLGGCCVGRPTRSRWGVWSSNRHVGVRRIPVQLMESALAGALALLTVPAVLAWGTSSDGAVFVAAVAAYTAGRQLLFPLREIPRATAHGRVVTLVVAGALSLTAVLVAVVR
jgi:phosphatidylglycerol:prolipoprotein diacylglycerol transferase